MLNRNGKIAAVLLAASFSVRPALLGENYSLIGASIIFLSGILFYDKNKRDEDLFYTLRPSIISTLFLFSFLTLHSLLQSTSNYYAASSFVLMFFCITGTGLLFSNAEIHDKYFSMFRVLLCLIAVSAAVTDTLATLVPVKTLFLFKVTIKTYVGNGDFFFPFTPAYNYKNFPWGDVPRLGAGFRESGIAQAFYAAAIATIPRVDNNKGRIQLALLTMGGFLTLSTLGFAIVALATSLRMSRFQKMSLRTTLFLVCIIVPFLLFAGNYALNNEDFGFASKEDGESYLDRAFAMEAGIARFETNPFGYGIYNSIFPSEGINLISSIGMIGIIGATLMIVNLVIATLDSYDKREKIELIFPLFITGLTSEAIFDCPLVYIFYLYLGSTVVRGMPRLRRPGVATYWSKQRLGPEVV